MDLCVYHNSPRSTLVRFLCLAHQCNLSCLSSIKRHVRPCESFGLYHVTESHMKSILIRYFIKSFRDEQELMKTNIKVLKVCHRTVGWMILKLNSHDMMMVLFWKACIDLLDKSSSSQNEWNDQKLLMNWQE